MADQANGKEEHKISEKPPVKRNPLPPKAAPQKPPANAGLPPKKTDNFGKVPKYLQKFQEEAKVKEDQKAAAKNSLIPGQPPGTKLMPESERLQTLAELEANKVKVN